MLTDEIEQNLNNLSECLRQINNELEEFKAIKGGFNHFNSIERFKESSGSIAIDLIRKANELLESIESF